MNIGVNTFGPKYELYKDWNGTIKKMQEAGVSVLEICVIFLGNLELPQETEDMAQAEEFQAAMGGVWFKEDAELKLADVRDLGMKVNSVHLMLPIITPEMLMDVLPEIKDFAVKHQIKYYVFSLMKGLEESKSFVQVFNYYCDELEKIGVQFVFHNHEIECYPEDGTTVLDYLMSNCPKLKLEIDTGWVKFAGSDTVDLMKKYKERLVLLHLKDIIDDASPENRATCFTAVGEGSIPLDEIMKEASRESQIDKWGVIIDQDDSLGDLLEDLKTGVKNIQMAIKD